MGIFDLVLRDINMRKKDLLEQFISIIYEIKKIIDDYAYMNQYKINELAE